MNGWAWVIRRVDVTHRRRRLAWPWLATVLAFVLAAPMAGHASTDEEADPFYIAFEGEVRAYIVIGDHASLPEKYAADELKSALKKMSGAELPVLRYSERPGGNEIVIGTPESVSVIAEAGLFNTDHEEEVRIVRQGTTLFLQA